MHNPLESYQSEEPLKYPSDLAGRLAHIAHASIMEASKNGQIASSEDIRAAIERAMIDGDPEKRYIPRNHPDLLHDVRNKYTEIAQAAVELAIPIQSASSSDRSKYEGWLAEHERKQDKRADEQAGFTS
jgi:hypothetical protein